MPRFSSKRNAPALDAAALDRLAVAYVGRYATTRAKLAAYLRRKLDERGWEGEGRPPVDAIVARCAALGYVDDRAFAEARAASLTRRGYGARRIGLALRAAGIDEEDAAPVREEVEESSLQAALAFAKRRRIGPFAVQSPSPAERQRMIAAMLRAGHAPAIARKIVDSAPNEEIGYYPE